MGDGYWSGSLYSYGLELLGPHHSPHAGAASAETELVNGRGIPDQVLPAGADT